MKKTYIKPEIYFFAEETDEMLSSSVPQGVGYRPDVVQTKRLDWDLPDSFEEFESFESSEIMDH